MQHIPLANDLILLFALAFALYRVGDAWTFQVVLFPLWRIVRFEDFPAYHRKHFHSIFGVIFVPMGFSAVGAVLLWFFPPPLAPRWLLATAVGLQAILFLSLLYWVPLQLKIEREGNQPTPLNSLDQGRKPDPLRSRHIVAGVDPPTSLIFRGKLEPM
jgi:hypothetical protein